MAMQHNSKSGRRTTGHGAADRARLAPADRRAADERKLATGISIAEVLHLLARRGYVRSFEPAPTGLWCRSSETCFDPATMVVESVTAVSEGTVLALRDTVSGVAGTWVVVERSERERPLLARLAWPPAATPFRRSAHGAAAAHAEVPFDRTA